MHLTIILWGGWSIWEGKRLKIQADLSSISKTLILRSGRRPFPLLSRSGWPLSHARCDNPDACWKAYQTKIELCPGIKINDWGKQPKGNGGGNNGGNNGGGGGGGRKGCDKEPGQLRGQCKPEDVGKWNCVKGESYQRCASGTVSNFPSSFFPLSDMSQEPIPTYAGIRS